MKLLKKMLFFLITLIMVVLVILLFAKKEYAFEQTISINNNSTEVYNFLKFLKNQEKYNDWLMQDAAIKASYWGEDGTTTSIYRWESNNSYILSGVQSIKKLNYPEHIRFELLIDKPYNVSCVHDFLVTEKNGKTELTWKINVYFPFPHNIVVLTGDFEKAISQSIKNSLRSIKKELEK